MNRQLSNGDVIRSMSDEQLAEFLDNYSGGEIDTSMTFCDLCWKEAALGKRSIDCAACTLWWVQHDSHKPQGLLYDTSEQALKGEQYGNQ